MRQLRVFQKGFTLIEVMVTVAVVAILASVALPSYSAYVQRSRVPPGLDALTAYAVRMEQRFQDTGSYGTANCGVNPLPTPQNFTVTCELIDDGKGFTATATGSGVLDGYVYTINHNSIRTSKHPKHTQTLNCWSVKGGVCDT